MKIVMKLKQTLQIDKEKEDLQPHIRQLSFLYENEVHNFFNPFH